MANIQLKLFCQIKRNDRVNTKVCTRTKNPNDGHEPEGLDFDQIIENCFGWVADLYLAAHKIENNRADQIDACKHNEYSAPWKKMEKKQGNKGSRKDGAWGSGVMNSDCPAPGFFRVILSDQRNS